MRKLKIQTAPYQGGFQAWVEGERNKRKSRSTSTSSAFTAARNLAVRLFLGHNHYAQLDAETVEKVVISQTGADTYLATYER